jgi:hypothetical protein
MAFVLLVSGALLFVIFRLWRGDWLGVEVALPLGVVIVVWFFAHLRLDARGVAITSLLFVSLIRVGAVEIGEWDIKNLRDWVQGSPRPIAYFLEHEDIWHEFGLISAAMSQNLQRINSEQALEGFLKNGGGVIFTDEMLSRTKGLKCVEWVRLKRRIKFPISMLLKDGLSIQNPDLHRNYHLCSLTDG